MNGRVHPIKDNEELWHLILQSGLAQVFYDIDINDVMYCMINRGINDEPIVGLVMKGDTPSMPYYSGKN